MVLRAVRACRVTLCAVIQLSTTTFGRWTSGTRDELTLDEAYSKLLPCTSYTNILNYNYIHRCIPGSVARVLYVRIRVYSTIGLSHAERRRVRLYTYQQL
jgi:hypothetical protein